MYKDKEILYNRGLLQSSLITYMALLELVYIKLSERIRYRI